MLWMKIIMLTSEWHNEAMVRNEGLPFELVGLSYSVQLTKSTPVFWSIFDPIRNQLWLVLAQDLLLDLQTCIRFPLIILHFGYPLLY